MNVAMRLLVYHSRTFLFTALTTVLFTFGTGLSQDKQRVPGLPPGGQSVSTSVPGNSRAPASLRSVIIERGGITLSTDAAGSLADSFSIQVQKPEGGTVRAAYFMAASTGFSNYVIPDGDILLEGQPVNWEGSATSGIQSHNFIANVTSQIASVINAAPAGRMTLSVNEGRSEQVDGVILAVIFDDPNQTQVNTVALFFGAQLTSGDQFNIGLVEPLDSSDPNTHAEFALGISFGYQISGQYSIINVNGQPLTSSAGGQDDGDGANGALITAGGIDDSVANPDDPEAGDQFGVRYDDELYDLKPFVGSTQQTISVNTLNPSGDDNIFFASLFISVPVIIGTADVAGVKFNDSNNNGARDTDEPAIFGWTMFINGPTSTSVQTDGSGKYAFTNLIPGIYTISEEKKPGWTQTFPDDSAGYTVTLDSGDVQSGLDFGNHAAPSTISGMKYGDLDGNGAKDSSEAGLEGWTITLSGAFLLTDVTDSSGMYSFSDLPPGLYYVSEEFRPGWQQISPSGPHVIDIDTPGVTLTGIDFGNMRLQPGTITGMKFNDLNADGVKDSLEPGIREWTISAYSYTTGMVVNVFTDSMGTYSFDSLDPGSYQITEEQRPGWTNTAPSGGGGWYINLSSGQVYTDADFGNSFEGGSLVTISGMKFNDFNKDGERDSTEPGIEGWTMYVSGSQSSITVHTDSSGEYIATGLPHDTYTVYEELRDGWSQSYPRAGFWEVDLMTDSVATGLDFGNYESEPILTLDRNCMNFATMPVGDGRTLTLHVTNIGSGMLTVHSVSSDNVLFTLENESSFSLSTGESHEISVRFTPTEPGEQNGTLTIESDAGAFSVALSGQGMLDSTGPGQEIFSGLVTIEGWPAFTQSVLGAYTTDGQLITSTLIEVEPESVQQQINYALSIVEGQAGIAAGDTIMFRVSSSYCEDLRERHCGKAVIFNPAFPPADGYTEHDVDAVYQHAVEIPIRAGFNALSWNVMPAHPEVTHIFGSLLDAGQIQIILRYVNGSGRNDRFDFYIPALGRYNPLQITDVRDGYFVRLLHTASPETLMVWGTPVCPGLPIALDSGYNFVSYLPNHPDSISHALQSIDSGNLEAALRFVNNGPDNSYFDFYPTGSFSVMTPGEGYFIRVDNPDTLIYPDTTILGPTKIRSDKGIRARVDSLGIPIPMFIYGTGVTLGNTLVPEGSEIRAVDNNGVECGRAVFVADGVYALAIYGDDPSTLEDEGAQSGDPVTIFINGQRLSQTITWGEFADVQEIGGELVVTDVLPEMGIPQTFSLEQNYPNPFNPVTAIRYGLPTSGSVILKVYDMLGKEVRTLVNEDQVAGFHLVSWDGRDEGGSPVSSGSYTLRMIATSGSDVFSAIRQMMLIR